jgi:hypothetical protein
MGPEAAAAEVDKDIGVHRFTGSKVQGFKVAFSSIDCILEGRRWK